MKKITGVAAALTLSGAMGAAHAAEPLQVAALTNVDGKVLIHKGKDYTIAKAGSPLIEGDRVITLKGSKADVAFAEGCVTSLKENAVLAIGGVDVCATGPLSANPEPVKYAQAIGAPVPTSAFTLGSSTGLGLSTGMGALIGGGTVLLTAGGELGTAHEDDDNDDRPISGQ
ncbi:hypothetical protein ebA6791 [Aromatoleum aromaticum EbN1]|uniref:Uncharacterized protein n=1 Tax=Aromatoleum aromaticum (strain DSM 19018 / LMG 30748 / EbN1) TaxID=76114 RepID=Q5NY56_AROAE|nr:hypothetical protein [Aromatoleum aromaticum]CAI10008.1 hypothetical protein ebA6791 [Aromatoleum aromaticum EbN1]